MRILTALLTLIVLAACGDDVADLRDVDFVMVSGDGQAATVNLDAGASGDARPMAVAGDEYFPDALVARFVVDGSGGTVVPTGASPVVLPPNLEADWYVARDGQRCTDPVDCGGPVNSTTLPNDSGYVDNLWRTPTVAGEYEMWAEAVSGDSVLRQLAYTGTVNAGPAWDSPFRMDDTLTMVVSDNERMIAYSCRFISGCDHFMFSDANGNAVPFTVEGAGWLPDTIAVLNQARDTAPALYFSGAPIGDTVTVRYWRDTVFLARAVVEVLDTVGDWGWRLGFMRDSLNLHR